MADLHFVDFALIPSPMRKETQFKLPDDFSEFILPILSRTSHSAFGFPALFQVFTLRADRCLAIRTWNILHYEGELGDARNFNISALRGRNRRCNMGKIVGGIIGFLASKASILSTTDYCYRLLSTLLVLEKVVYLIRWIKITNPLFCLFA